MARLDGGQPGALPNTAVCSHCFLHLVMPLAGPAPAREAGLPESTLHTQESALTAATSDVACVLPA